ncbi:hypothetical protein [Jannaschia seosinensis]|uniref:hypothetical protein n=1 Tax=Jannaschia seosinensis TaxID=313367 RepID=UPI00118759A2|nr:hypothetical protein [Jannaschia seosinensis]
MRRRFELQPFSKIIALTISKSGNPDFPLHLVDWHEPVDHLAEGNPMSKGNNRRGNRENKKPKQEKPKVSATSVAAEGKSPLTLAGKKVK